MQLKETGAGEVTVWFSEKAVTLGATGKEKGDIQKELRIESNYVVT